MFMNHDIYRGVLAIWSLRVSLGVCLQVLWNVVYYTVGYNEDRWYVN